MGFIIYSENSERATASEGLLFPVYTATTQTF